MKRYALGSALVCWIAGVLAVASAQVPTAPPTAAPAQILTAPPVPVTPAEARAAYADDVHNAAGVTCQGCHTAAKADVYTAPSRTAIPKLCATCHADAGYMKKFDPQVRIDQYERYLTSTHGRQHAKGEARVAVCSDCHGAHGVRRVKDPRAPVAPPHVAETCAKCHSDAPRMAHFGKDTAPPVDWRKSVHAKALVERGDTSAPTCSTCHGSHGAAPPEVESVALVCAQCHVREADLFRASPKKPLFDALAQAECVTCHSNHDIESPVNTWLGSADGVGCGECHDDSIAGADAIRTMRRSLDDLSGAISTATERVDRAEQAGVLVEEARGALREASEQRIHARVMVHAFKADEVVTAGTKGLDAARSALAQGDAALAEVRYRRTGLAIATVFIIGFLISLGLKIRRLGPG